MLVVVLASHTYCVCFRFRVVHTERLRYCRAPVPGQFRSDGACVVLGDIITVIPQTQVGGGRCCCGSMLFVWLPEKLLAHGVSTGGHGGVCQVRTFTTCVRLRVV